MLWAGQAAAVRHPERRLHISLQVHSPYPRAIRLRAGRRGYRGHPVGHRGRSVCEVRGAIRQIQRDLFRFCRADLVFLWLYAGWLIVLIGAQFSFFHQHPTAYLSRLLWQQGTHAISRTVGLEPAGGPDATLCEREASDDRGPELAIELHLPVSLVEEQVEHLVEYRAARPHGQTGRVSVLTKPPELISIKEVLDAAREGNPAEVHIPIGTSDPVVAVLRRRDKPSRKRLRDTPCDHSSPNRVMSPIERTPRRSHLAHLDR